MADLTDNQKKLLQSVFYDLTGLHLWQCAELSKTPSWYDKRSANALVRRGWLIETEYGYDLSDKGLVYCQQEFSKPYRADDWSKSGRAAEQFLGDWVEKHQMNPILYRWQWESYAKRWHEASVDWNINGGAIINHDLHERSEIARRVLQLIDNMSLN